MRYKKDLSLVTTFRISPALREQADVAAHFSGISFSDFIRQSLSRNIHVSAGIEDEVNRRTTRLTCG